jgi:hypothetical protein
MRKLCAVLLVVCLAACSHHIEPAPVKPVTFSGPAYQLDVAKITVIEDFDRSDTSRSYALAREIYKWVEARLAAAGSDKILEVHVTDASIAKKSLPKQKTGITGLFTKEQTEELSGRLAVDLKLYSPEKTLPIAFAQVSAELSRTVREDASLEDRKAVHRKIVAEIMKEVDGMLDEKIRTYFSKYLR